MNYCHELVIKYMKNTSKEKQRQLMKIYIYIYILYLKCRFNNLFFLISFFHFFYLVTLFSDSLRYNLTNFCGVIAHELDYILNMDSSHN